MDVTRTTCNCDLAGWVVSECKLFFISSLIFYNALNLDWNKDDSPQR